MSSWLAKVIERSGTVKLVCFEHQLVTTSVFTSRPITDYNNAESSGHKWLVEATDPRRVLVSGEARGKKHHRALSFLTKITFVSEADLSPVIKNKVFKPIIRHVPKLRYNTIA
jgi:hypothetical protein